MSGPWVPPGEHLSVTATGSGITGNPVRFAATGVGYTIAARSVITQSALLNTAVGRRPRCWCGTRHSGGGHTVTRTAGADGASGDASGDGRKRDCDSGEPDPGPHARRTPPARARPDPTSPATRFCSQPTASRSSTGPKLVGTGAGNADQGYSVSLSADGNTAIIGGPNSTGAAWVWTRAEGPPAGAQAGRHRLRGARRPGAFRSLSADGNTAIAGGLDNGDVGAAWI